MNKNLIVTALTAVFALGLVGPLTALAAGPSPVNLGTAGNFVILGETGISSTGSTTITGDVGISPGAASLITGFGLILNPAGTVASSSLVTGKIYAANYAAPTPAYMTTAIQNMYDAYVDAAGRTGPTSTNLGAGIIGGLTFTPGLYKWTTDVSMAASATSSDVTLSGGANDVWIFQIAGDLNVASGGATSTGAKIILTGGADAKNVFWQVGGSSFGATLGTYSTFKGTILSAKQVIIQTGARLTGQALAQTQVTLDTNTVLGTGSSPAILNVVKLVINVNGGTATSSSFIVHVKNSSSTEVTGSPLSGAAAPGTPYVLAPGTYTVSENPTSYAQSFDGNCPGGSITLTAGQNKTCTIINTDPMVSVMVAAGGGGSSPIVPVIGILKVPAPLALPGGSGSVTYNYTVWNVGGQVPLVNVTVADNKCSPVVMLSGDSNSNGKLDSGENWRYSCTTTLSQTTTNTAIATGYSDDSYHQAAVATAIATVVVGAPLTAPLIAIVKVPSRLTPFPAAGGNVTYRYTVTNPGVVAMNNVIVTDDKCGPVSRVSGDANGNGLLDPGESWVYTCQMNIRVSTRNVATAEGRANGFTALGYAFANVLVTTPGLPNTGLPPEGATGIWSIVLLSGALLIVLALTAVALSKRKIWID